MRNSGAYAVQRSKLFQHGPFPLIKVKRGRILGKVCLRINGNVFVRVTHDLSLRKPKLGIYQGQKENILQNLQRSKDN